MSINTGCGVINVRKREENRQTNSSSVMAVLMITAWCMAEEREGGRIDKYSGNVEDC